MSEEELLKLLQNPGSLALVVIWIHFRVKRLEGRLDVLALHLGVPRPRRKSISGFNTLTLLLVTTLAYLVIEAVNFHNL